MAMVGGRLCEAPEGDYFVTCSFDPNHVLLRSRMPYHLIKCIKNHPNHTKCQCPYDSTEYIDIDKFQAHVKNCESRRSVDDEKYEIARLKASGRLCNFQPVPVEDAEAPEEPVEVWRDNPRNELKNDIHDFNEDVFDNTRAIGRATGRLCNVQPVKVEAPQEPDKVWRDNPRNEMKNDIHDFNEDVFDNNRAIGRACRSRGRGKSMPKIGRGRAEILKRVIENYSQRLSADASSSSNVGSDLKRDICIGQFEDE